MFRLGAAVALAAALADQASKWWILESVMQPPRVIEVAPFFNLVLGWNKGASFGLLSGANLGPWPFVALAVAVSAGLLAWLARATRPALACALGLVLGGAAGNALDRVRFGAVVDFLDLHWAGWHWPAFNLADSAITMGVAILLADALFSRAR